MVTFKLASLTLIEILISKHSTLQSEWENLSVYKYIQILILVYRNMKLLKTI
jgi:hypothetical protein